jgi:hypothetical protein
MFGAGREPEADGDRHGQAEGINGLGQVAGDYVDARGIPHGFVDDGGTFAAIDIPGASYTALSGLNDAGQLVGSASGYGSFLATPLAPGADPGGLPTFAAGVPVQVAAAGVAPEPSTLALAVLGLPALWRACRRGQTSRSRRGSASSPSSR